MGKRTDIKSILIIGAGPIVIGQACEFDYSGTQACKALKEEGYRIIADVQRKVGTKAFGFGRCRHCDHDGSALGLLSNGGQSEWPSRLGNRNDGRPFAHDSNESGVVLKRGDECMQW